ncbi:hypothetical protein LRS74_26930 [Streptomyces sp. LX-29]|uniref:hypothetical protein n=1 Tax=Streptomyces sp. LX-29 TaxID=2900152 RepID=UPI00240DECEF|nr:hypothetical protein [Streptomyces sp. LX-29]WFB10269.1 hypothetical protein LRS74_26930 [Streptomyces sp. LX-29]
MSRMLEVSDDVRAEIGDDEANRLLAGENAPGSYDCTSCRTPGHTEQERTSTVLFVGQETAVLAFAHATCVPSQVVPVAEEQLQGAVRSFSDVTPASEPAALAPSGPGLEAAPRQAVLNVTCGLVLVQGEPRPALVVEPTSAIARPGTDGPGDDFLPLLIEQGFRLVGDVSRAPSPIAGWSVLMAMGQLHAVLMPGGSGTAPVAWWQAHRPMPVTDDWRTAVGKSPVVMVYAAPVGSIGNQPREDQLRIALDRAAAKGALVAAAMPLSGT